MAAKAAARAACDPAQLPQKSLKQIRRRRAAVLEVAGQPVPHVLLFFQQRILEDVHVRLLHFWICS